jgi:hypothetical protein
MSEPKHIVIKHKTSRGAAGAAHPKTVHTRPTVPPVLRKKKSKAPAIAIGVIMALVVLAGGWLLLNAYKTQQREALIEAMALLELKKQAATLHGRLPGTFEKMDGFLDQAGKVADGVAMITGFVTNRADDAAAGAATAAVPPHHAALAAIGRDLADSREALVGLRIQMMDWQAMLETKHDAVLKAYSRAIAAPAVVEIEKHLQAIEDLLGEARARIRQMEAKASEAEGIKAEEIRLRAAHAEAQRRQREAEALQRLTESEVRQAAALVSQSKASIPAFAFAEALVPLENAQAGFTTAPGREALAVPVERLKRLQSLKTQLINGLNKSPYRWGWGTTAADSQDITGANETGLKITKGIVPWKDVPIPQLMKIIDHLGKTERRLSSERGEDTIALAILLDELGMKTQASERVRDAITINRYMADAARRLLPDCR